MDKILLTISLVLTFAVIGCSPKSSSGLVPVHGEVLFNGQPVFDGTIGYLHEDGIQSYSGRIRNGHYSLGNQEVGVGAVPGKYRVSIVSIGSSQSMTHEDTPKASPPAIPQKYSTPDSSGLNADVTEAGGVFNFNLNP